ncbi:MAG: hypothetical protein HYW48_00190 [Deltaproteobacteria bacterium]|nr:hypothetical protein [Deltaproteobacteria bacterium]
MKLNRYLSVGFLGLTLLSSEAFSVPRWLLRMLCCQVPPQVETFPETHDAPNAGPADKLPEVFQLVTWNAIARVREWFVLMGDPQIRDRTPFNRTLMHLALTPEMARLLHEAGVPVDEGDVNGITPLGHAVFLANRELALTLVELGANPQARDARGLPVLNEEQTARLQEWQAQQLPGHAGTIPPPPSPALEHPPARRQPPAPRLERRGTPRRAEHVGVRLSERHQRAHTRYREGAMQAPTLSPVSSVGSLSGAAEAPF